MRTGLYRHYKGQFYLVLGTGHDSNHPRREVVVYVPLYVAKGPRLAVRDRDEFEGTVEVDGRTVPRFKWVSDE